MLLSLRGSVCLYQGEELALPEADVPYERLQDPYGLTFWPEFKGRDGCRTPFPWETDAAHVGFSSSEPWLPMAASHRVLAADVQAAEQGSMLRFSQAFLAWRRHQPALRTGSLRFLDAPDPLLCFLRSAQGGEGTLLSAFNLGASAQTLAVSLDALGAEAADADPASPLGLPSLGGAVRREVPQGPLLIDLPPFGALIHRITITSPTGADA